VKVRFFQALASSVGSMDDPVRALSPLLKSAWAFAGLALMNSTAWVLATRNASTMSGCCCRNSVRTTMSVVTNWPLGHNEASSTRTLPPAATSCEANGSGTQAPWMAPDWKAVTASALAIGVMVTSPVPVWASVARPFCLSQ
jgi:hypothetical protein